MTFMQDKEFDQAIQQHLESLNPAVPPRIWERMEAELDRKENKPVAGRKNRPVHWLVAASILTAAGLGWWMSRPAEVIYLHGTYNTTAAEETARPESRPVEQEMTAVPPAGEQSIRKPVRTRRPEALTSATTPAAVPQVAAAPTGQVVMLTEESEIPHAALYQELSKVPLQTSIVRADDQPATITHLENIPVLVSADAIPRLTPQSDKQLPERRAFGVSSLLNIVVGAVDNRQEKIITFTEDSEGMLFIDFKGIAGKKKR